MNKTLFIIFLCLAGIANGEPEEVDLGEYRVYFDLGIDKNEYKMNASGPIYSEDLGGKEKETWSIYIEESKNDDFVIEIASIDIINYEGIEAPNEEELSERIYNWGFKVYDVSTDQRTIDGKEAAIARVRFGFKHAVFGEIPITGYFTYYSVDNDTLVSVFSSYEWDDGTLNLLKSLRVEEN